MGGNEDMGQLMEIHQSKVVEIINSDWDLIIIDDLFWTFGFALTTLKHRLWEKNGGGGGGGKETKSIIYSTAGQTLLSAESIKSTGRDWVSKSPLFPFIPTDKNDAYTPKRFTHRLHALFENGAEYILMNWIVEQFLMPNIARFGVPNFTWKELYTRSSLQLSDSIDRLGWPLSKGPEMINIGAHCKNPGKMPEKFRKFIEEENSEGTIYVAFGTYPEWSLAPKRIISALIGAFERLNKFKIIFAYNGPPIKNLNKIFSHPKTKAYITHGGLKSVREGLCSGVPLILMPLFAEQAHNAQQLLFMGIGPVINKYTLTVDSVYSTIYSTVSNPKNILISKRFRSIFLDRPIKALDEGLFWIERITRLKPGRKVYFERKGINLTWINFLYFDFIIFIFIFIYF
uniref:glucuronosyltransferase n=1 Tax=Meloidogyne enterolobii TaxID=390850 RepID=A0A6V7WD43_MELEN|nr:unnamed protein product [Meloidogyne enterolobii]